MVIAGYANNYNLNDNHPDCDYLRQINLTLVPKCHMSPDKKDTKYVNISTTEQ